MRAVALGALALFVAAGLGGAFGVRSGTARAVHPSGLQVVVTYPRVARPGLAVPLSIRISKPGGFDGPIEVAVPTAYLQLFDENGFEPDPAESTADATDTRWTFDPPDGDTLTIWLDTRVEPGVQWRRHGSVRVVADGDALETAFETWIAP